MTPWALDVACILNDHIKDRASTDFFDKNGAIDDIVALIEKAIEDKGTEVLESTAKRVDRWMSSWQPIAWTDPAVKQALMDTLQYAILKGV